MTNEGTPTGKPTAGSLPGSESKLEFRRDIGGLKIQLPPQEPGPGPHVLRIAGLHLP
jgi:hypothetical protein